MDEDAVEMTGDIIARLIEGDMLSEQQWRPAATLDFLTQALVDLAEQDDETTKEFATQILGSILTWLTYLQIHEPDEEDLEQEVYDRKWQEILESIEKPKPKEDEE